MARIRSIHPGFFTDEHVVSVSMAARICIIGLGIEADDKGVFEWKPVMLKMRLFPADNVVIDDLLTELEEAGIIRKFSQDGKFYGAIKNFRKFQKPKTPNDVHPISEEMRAFVGLEAPITEINGVKHRPFPQKGEIAPLMEEGGEDVDLEPDGSRASRDAPEVANDDHDDDRLRPEHIVAKWNELAPSMGKPKVRDITPERRQLLKARIGQYSVDDFVTVFGNIRGSPFLRGDTGKQFCTFDWAMKKANFQKILEGNYAHG